MSWRHLHDHCTIASKRYTCGLCEGIIGIGERHVVRTGFRDRHVSTLRMHRTCEEASRNLDDDTWATLTPEDFRREMLGIKENANG